MKLNLNDDQLMLQDTVSKLFKTESTPERIRAAEETNGFDQGLWTQVVELGFHAMRATEAAGGLEMSLLDAAVVAEEQGRYIASIPLNDAMVANRLLSQLSGDAAASTCEKALGGSLITLLPVELNTEDTVLVPWAAVAEGVVALEGNNIYLLEGLQGPVDRNLANGGHRIYSPSEGSRTLIGEGPQAREQFLAAIEEWKILTAASLAGLSRQALAMAAEYANEREQFGRLIGSYQGIAHPLADSFCDVDGAHLLVWKTIWALATEKPDAAGLIDMAYWWATQVSSKAAARSLHTFGGYGVSLEYDIQLYYRRAKAWSIMAGDPQMALQRAGDRLWGGETACLPDTGTIEIDFSLGEKAEKIAQELREFFEANLTDELRAKAHHSVAGYDEEFSKKMCAAGLRYPHWSKEYGGREATPFEMSAIYEVMEEYGWERVTGGVTNQIAQGVMAFAREDVKEQIIGELGRGEALACIGFSEPSSGSDIYGAKTRAVRDGDDWIINGQKIFTTSGNLAKYIMLLTRTNPDAPKHKGLTIFVVPMDLPGIEIQPVYTLMDERTNITYIENVRLPDKYRLGEVDGGIKVMLHAMSMEHGSGDSYRYFYESMLAHTVEWAKTTKRNGHTIIEEPQARQRIAQATARHEVAKVLCGRAVWAAQFKIPNSSFFGPMSKVFSVETYLQSSIELADLAAPWSLFEGDEGAGHIEIGFRQSIGTTIYGGTSEIMRSLIAEHGLGLPKSRS